jgi:agmatine deiminase
MTGHADGMVRFANKNTILGNRRDEESDTWKKNMQRATDKFGLTYIEVPLITDIIDKEHPDSAIGVYVNYLEVNNLIVMPVFGREEDQKAFDIIQKAFPNKVIETIDYNDVAQEGGLLNCTTWVITA